MYHYTATTMRGFREYSSVLRSSCWQLLHHSSAKEEGGTSEWGRLCQRRSPSGALETCKENTVMRRRGDEEASARSEHPRGRPSRTQVSLLETSIGHIYLAAVLWSMHQHLRNAIAVGNL